MAAAPGFFGNYEHSLDGKGRVVLPVKFRPAFADGGYLTHYDEGCLALWTPDELAVKAEQMKAKEAEGPEGQRLMRVWAASCYEVEVDRQGRMPIPPKAREFARLTPGGGVVLQGAISRVELWGPEVWSRKLGEAERSMFNRDEVTD